MLKLTIEEMLARIGAGITFEATCIDGSFSLKIEEYTPIICAAIHDGHQLRPELKEKCLLSDHERWYEEDPETATFINSLPITFVGHDSRYEYDLNRPPESAVYDIAWGKKVWASDLSSEEIEASLLKRRQFYRVLHVLVARIEQQYGACIVFDIHSYNYKRWNRHVPLFNLGTLNIDRKRFQKTISRFRRELKKITIPNIVNVTATNDVFKGSGYLLKYLTGQFSHTLVFATEVKKIYCNEGTGEKYPVVIEELSAQLKIAILNTSTYFARIHTNLKKKGRHFLLSKELDNAIIQSDKQLYRLTRNFEILNYINPLNLEQEKRRFFASSYRRTPLFRYRHLNIDPYLYKRKLYNLPVDQINDPHIRTLYQDIVHAYADKTDILATIGSNKFLYNSLRYFGEPTERDVSNARFILYSPNHIGDEDLKVYSDTVALEKMMEMAHSYGFNCKADISPNLVSKALVINSKKLVRVKKGAQFTRKSLMALSHHEIGVHMVTTINATLQPLYMPRLGAPLNTLTQEGLAVLSEYLSGNITLGRLKELALRVLAVDMLVKGHDFIEVFEFLMDDGNLDQNAAYYLTSRVFRGGGFTKDHLYLRGFRLILKHYHEGKPLDNLLIGKMSLKYLPVLDEMVQRRFLLPPKYKTRTFQQNSEENPIIRYLIEGLK
jgi:uncharacterized protein (TIGR02421 family)